MRIEIKDLSFNYKNGSPKVLNGLNAVFSSGAAYVLRGNNGAGKTTLSKLIAGLYKNYSGIITIDGRDIKKDDPGTISKRIGYLFQNSDHQLFATSIYEELIFPFEITGTLDAARKEKIQSILTKFGLNSMSGRFPLTMSGGEKKRLAIATVMVRDIEFLLFDEPTSSMDGEGREFIGGFINEFIASGGGAIVITHDEAFQKLLIAPVVLNIEGGTLHEA